MSEAPNFYTILNLWTLGGHPSPQNEWSNEQKFVAIQEEGFSGFTWWADPELTHYREKYPEMKYVHGFDAPHREAILEALKAASAAGSEVANVQLLDHDTPVSEAIDLTLFLMEEAEKVGVRAHVEYHRDTCTETPEKMYAIADGYRAITGELLRISLDYSHPAIIKHIAAADFSKRLLDRPDLIQHSELFHCRPFNGHHCQIPVTDGQGNLTKEFEDYAVFAEDLFAVWLAGKRPNNSLYMVPEMGNIESGYGISTWPAPFEDAIRCTKEMQACWERALAR